MFGPPSRLYILNRRKQMFKGYTLFFTHLLRRIIYMAYNKSISKHILLSRIPFASLQNLRRLTKTSLRRPAAAAAVGTAAAPAIMRPPRTRAVLRTRPNARRRAMCASVSASCGRLPMGMGMLCFYAK